MNCRKVTHLLSAYMDGELPGVEHRMIHDHLLHCADCRADYEELLQMKRLLGRMRIQAAHRDMPVQIIRQIHAEERNVKSQRSQDWGNALIQLLRTKLTLPQTLSLGLGFAVVATLYLGQINLSPQRTDDLINVTWNERSVHEFTNGIQYADAESFLSRPDRNSFRTVSSEALFSDNDTRLFSRHPRTVQIEQLVFRQR